MSDMRAMMVHSVGMRSSSTNIITRLPLLIDTLDATAAKLNGAQPVGGCMCK